MQPDVDYGPGSAYHRARRWTQPHSLRCLDVAMTILGTPRSLLDVGCGAEAPHVRRALALGIDAVGIDLAAPESDPACLRADVRQPVDLARTFEWVLCWELAEHLPAGAADTLCDTLVRHLDPAGRLIFTAAGPGQRGPGHIHCVERTFWHQHFVRRGLSYAVGLSDRLRAGWRACAPQTPWYWQNVIVYWRQA